MNETPTPTPPAPAAGWDRPRRMFHVGAGEWCLVKPDSCIGTLVWVRFGDGRQHFADWALLVDKPNPNQSGGGQ